MSEIFIPLLFLVIGVAIGAFISNRFTFLKNKSETSKLEAAILNTEEQKDRLESEIQEVLINLELMRTEKDSFKNELTKKTTEFTTLEKKLEDQEEKLRIQFENLANKILDKKSDKFTEQNKKNLDLLLNPLHKKIESFEKKVETSQKESVGMHAALKQQLESLKDLNQQMSKEAINLTKALKGDSKAQGDWGEIQLEIILEKAGLSNGIHFTSQGGYRDENENLKKPDFIINLPDNKHLIVDSKVSLTAYEGYFSSENKEDKDNHLKKHIASIRKHIKELSEKQYTELYGINTPDYVLMFVPIEAALLIAFNENNKLYLEAFDKNVVLVSTSTLLATLSTVSSIWKQEDQKRNVIEIARQAGALYDKFVGLVEDLTGVGKKLESAKNDYSSAMNKLVDGRGNLIASVEKIKKLGAKAKKSIPEQILLRSEEED
jgi:DNA recombination protein RmuC|nr:DNA recombination protein RmuC [uncultured bacterium]|tara:strand:+ start:288 stop:1589 length:1302 start_codon:yes stop_codon:yes gene_type:complete